MIAASSVHMEPSLVLQSSNMGEETGTVADPALAGASSVPHPACGGWREILCGWCTSRGCLIGSLCVSYNYLTDIVQITTGAQGCEPDCRSASEVPHCGTQKADNLLSGFSFADGELGTRPTKTTDSPRDNACAARRTRLRVTSRDRPQTPAAGRLPEDTCR